MGMFDFNPIMLTDSYNLSHQGLKINTDFEVSHIYNRKKGMILYGLNEIIGEFLTRKITKENVDEAHIHAIEHGEPFPRNLWIRVVEELNGYVPLQIETLPEGTWCPAGTPFAQVRNTVKGFGELVTWFEGILLHSWFPCGVATEAFEIRRYIDHNKLPLNRIHSFGFRGHQNIISARQAGMAWNLFFVGTDDFHTLKHTPQAKMKSIPALAHKVTQQFDVEYDCYTHAIDYAKKCGAGIVALVIDTYDAGNFIHAFAKSLAKYAKERGVHIVFRPDSGDVINQAVQLYELVGLEFSNTSVIIGEDITQQKIHDYDHYLITKGVPLEFASYGIGAGLYKHLTRDTLGFAMKTAYSNGAPRMKFSQIALKRSIPGIVKVCQDAQGLYVEDTKIANGGHGLYKVIYHYTQFMAENRVEPFFMKEHWVKTQERALTNVTVPHLQQDIRLSDAIHENIEIFRKRYKG